MKQNFNTSTNQESPKQGCGNVVVFVFISLWVIVICAADLFVNWMVEQSLFEVSTVIPDTRLINHLVFSLLLLISLLIAYFVVKTPRMKSAFHIWVLASGLALLASPLKMLWITYQQETAVMAILALLIFESGLLIFRPKQASVQKTVEKKQKKRSIFGFAALIASFMTIPWVLWGALGSLTDVILCVLLGIVFGVFAVQVLYPYFFQKILSTERELTKIDYLVDSFIVAIFLLILMTGLSQNGSQAVLIICFPIAGGILTYLAILAKGNEKEGKLCVGMIAALALILPQAWFDMDELALLINGSSGGTLDWAGRAAWFTFSVALVVLLVAVFNFSKASKISLPKRMNWLLPLIGISALCTLYFLFGQPGFYGEKIFVVMKDQSELSEVSNISDLADRRQSVYSTLVQGAEESQKGIRAQLDQWHLSYTPYYLVNGIEVNASPYYQMLISQRDDVARILESPQLRPLPKEQEPANTNSIDLPTEIGWNLKFIGVDRVREEYGLTGKGIVIGQTDTGVDGFHPQLTSSYRGIETEDDYNWLDPWYQSTFPHDLQGHGTSTLAIITGKDIGIAPDAKWIGCVNMGRNLGNPAKYLDCMQFMLAPYPQNGNAFTDGEPAQGANIINNSWGCPTVEGCDSQTFDSAVSALQSAGIFMSVAAGNTGYYGCSTVTDPLAIYSTVFSVGSINKDGQISDFSSLGPVSVDGSLRIKPDILAPGEDIITAFPDKSYTIVDGTSIAAPQVAGVVALMWEANPGLIGNIDLTTQILEETASPYKGTIPDCINGSDSPNSAAGYGIVDAYAAVEKALSLSGK